MSSLLLELTSMYSDWSPLEWLSLLLIFVWSGFVRGGLGFGGAGLALPLLLILKPDPVFWLPMMAWHLLLFSIITLTRHSKEVDWQAVKRGLKIMFIPKFIGVLGLVSLPSSFLAMLVYTITLIYGLAYIWDFSGLNLSERSSRLRDRLLLIIGGYVSGTSLVGAPIIAAVYTQWVDKRQLRYTMYVLWVFMVTVKMSTFVVFDLPLQWGYSLLLLLPVSLGHWIGSRLHLQLLPGQGKRFHQFIGVGLTVVCIIGMIRVLSS